ncbi:MAG: hypothetical protein MSP08_09415 [Clostridiales bacterium]|nr:hypothetical protein [Clostridiales bacterium]
MGNNDLDFYQFLNEHGALPDIITCRRFALHDANPLPHACRTARDRSGFVGCMKPQAHL